MSEVKATLSLTPEEWYELVQAIDFWMGGLDVEEDIWAKICQQLQEQGVEW